MSIVGGVIGGGMVQPTPLIGRTGEEELDKDQGQTPPTDTVEVDEADERFGLSPRERGQLDYETTNGLMELASEDPNSEAALEPDAHAAERAEAARELERQERIEQRAADAAEAEQQQAAEQTEAIQTAQEIEFMDAKTIEAMMSSRTTDVTIHETAENAPLTFGVQAIAQQMFRQATSNSDDGTAQKLNMFT